MSTQSSERTRPEKDGPGGQGYCETEDCPLCGEHLGVTPLYRHLPDCPWPTEVRA